MKEKRLLQKFVKEKNDKHYILVKVLKTEGSTYCKAGAMKVITLAGESAGLISGGCIENDIVQIATSLDGSKKEYTIDTTADDDIYSYGQGCKGKLTLTFEKISAEFILNEDYLGIHEKDCLKVSVVGAGMDVIPLQELMTWHHWDISFYTSNMSHFKDRLASGWDIYQLHDNTVKEQINVNNRNAILLFSHNYYVDLMVLMNIWKLDIEYIGVLGPHSRKTQLIKDLSREIGPLDSDEIKRVRGPVGLEGFGRGASSIAMSVVSELHQTFFGN